MAALEAVLLLVALVSVAIAVLAALDTLATLVDLVLSVTAPATLPLYLAALAAVVVLLHHA